MPPARARVAPARRVSDDSGAAAVEFALVVPFLVFVLVILVTVGSLTIQYQQLHAGAREGARYAALTQSTVATIRTRAVEGVGGANFTVAPAATVFVQPQGQVGWGSALAADVRPCNQTSGSGERRVRVVLTATARPDVPILSLVSIPMTAQGIFRCE